MATNWGAIPDPNMFYASGLGGFGSPSTAGMFAGGTPNFNELTGMPNAAPGAIGGGQQNPLAQFGFQQAPNNQLFLPWSAWQQQIQDPNTQNSDTAGTVAGYNVGGQSYTDPNAAYNAYISGMGSTSGTFNANPSSPFALPGIQDTLANTNNPSYFMYNGSGTPSTMGGQQGFLLDPSKLGVQESSPSGSTWDTWRNGPIEKFVLPALALGAGAEYLQGAGAGADAASAAGTAGAAGAGDVAAGTAAGGAATGVGDLGLDSGVTAGAFSPATDAGVVATGAPAIDPITGQAAASGGGNLLSNLLGGGSGSGGGLSGLLGGLGSAIGNTAPGLAALNYARQNQPIDTSQLNSVFNQSAANAPLFTQASIAPAQQAQAQGYGDLLQSQGQRGIRGSSFGNTDISNFLNSTNTNIGNIGANAAAQALGLQGALAGNIAQLNAQSQLMRNNLYGRAFDLLGRGLGAQQPGGGNAGGALGSGIGSLLGSIGSGLGNLFTAS